jgi:pectin methylesterase-like acyl-CoA thioesterase
MYEILRMHKAVEARGRSVSAFILIVAIIAFWAGASGAGEKSPIAFSNSVPDVSSLSGILVVSSDGTAKFKTVQAAINAAATGTVTNPTIIRIKPGTYKELIYIQREKRFLRLIGENPTNYGSYL